MSEYTTEQIREYKAENERKIRAAASKGDEVIDGMPLKVTLELTADCDLFCKMCEFVVPRERGRKKGYALHMGVPEFEMLAPQVFAAARFVNLTVVGEPFLVPYLDRVLEICKEWQTRIEFVTHGMYLSQAMIEKVGSYTQSMIISFDGGTRATFDRIRVGARFDAVTRNMLRFERWRKTLPADAPVPAFIMAVTLMRENIEELPTIVRISKLLGVDKVSAAWMISFSEKMARSSAFRHKALANACLRRAREVASELGIVLEVPVEFPGVDEKASLAITLQEPELPDGPLPHLKPWLDGTPLPADDGSEGPELDPASIEAQMEAITEWIPDTDTLQHPTPSMGEMLPTVDDPIERIFVPAEPPRETQYTCRFLWNELFVAVNGDVTPCCIQGRPVVGNVFKENLDQVWNGEGMREMRRRLRDGDPVDCCRDCNYNTMLGHGDYKEDTFFVPLDRDV